MTFILNISRTPYWYRHSYHQPHSLQFFAPPELELGGKAGRQGVVHHGPSNHGHLNNNNKEWLSWLLLTPDSIVNYQVCLE